jgi:nitrate/nitrite transporter NarK
MAEKKGRNWRWGLLSMLFLGIALAAVLTSNAQGRYTGLTLAMLLVGFGGAAFCSVKGLKNVSWLPR